MILRLKFFATLRDRFKTSEKKIKLEEPQEAREVFFNLFDDKDLARRLIRSTRFAVNCEYVPPDTLMRDNDELAFIPPVSGG